MAGKFPLPSSLYWTCLRWTVAAVWLYQGAWQKILSVDEHHLSIVSEAAVPGLSPRLALAMIGLGESLLAVAVLLKIRPRWIAWTQVGLLAFMNGMGLLFARDEIVDPAGMILMNLVFALAALGCGYAAADEGVAFERGEKAGRP